MRGRLEGIGLTRRGGRLGTRDRVGVGTRIRFGVGTRIRFGTGTRIGIGILGVPSTSGPRGPRDRDRVPRNRIPAWELGQMLPTEVPPILFTS